MTGYTMQFILITPKGQEFEFYVEEMAILYKGIYGGDIIRRVVSIQDLVEVI